MKISHQQTVKDRVCDMMVPPDQYAIDYLGMHFAFCSLQCKERFLANPHLYIGEAGHKAPKQEGREILKRRRLRLAEALPETMARQVSDEIRSMMGIKHIHIDGANIDITYDLLQATELQIEARLDAIGVKLGKNRAQQLRRAFVHYIEETEVDSLVVGASQHHH